MPRYSAIAPGICLRQSTYFTGLKIAAEVGDCYSLLGRTYLAAGQRPEARAALAEANKRLLDQSNKDYLDLQIAMGDLVARHEP